MVARLSADEIRGLEYDWIASDADGRVGIFSTAGGGFAPDSLLANAEAHEAAIEAVLGLPPSTSAVFAPVLRAGFPNIWLQAAERGLFGFDSDPNGGDYRLVSAPVTEARVTDLPPGAAGVALKTQFSEILFGDLRTLSADRLRASTRAHDE